MTPINEDLLPKDARLLPTEAEEQATLFSWAEMQSEKYPELALMYHISNGGSRKKSEAARFKAEGVKGGVPDIVLPVARGGYHGLYIELKRLKGGRVEKNQQEWHDRLREQGYAVYVCRGWKQASECLVEYLEQRPYPQTALPQLYDKHQEATP